jgi:hypothetical protein
LVPATRFAIFCDITCEFRRVIGLAVDTERREATIIGRAKALLIDILCGSNQAQNIVDLIKTFAAGPVCLQIFQQGLNALS